MEQYIDIVFDGSPSDVCGRFVEVENEQGQSISVGTWIDPTKAPGFNKFEDVPLWRLRIKVAPSLTSLSQMIADNANSKGFDVPSEGNLGSKLMLSVSELSEAMEEFRDSMPAFYWACNDCEDKVLTGELMPAKPDEECGCGSFDWKPEGVAVELADSNIRNLHMIQALYPDLDVDWVHREKMMFNSTRPPKHGRVRSL